uniref:Myxovirus (influenza virus) resistance D n=1 Tax=Sinocyclocheilus grahami TaxID=75366 RepID=A0A672NR04_SINGR
MLISDVSEARCKPATTTTSISQLVTCDNDVIYVILTQNELAGKGVGISDELITLEIMSPDVCDLTLIDLPGIARVPVNGQPEDIGKQIKRLIMKYINKRETINLDVVPCDTDIATTEPDLIDKETEKSVLAIVHNKVIPLRKGYIMVKCRGQQQIDDAIPLEEAAQMERDFFQNHDYFRCLLEMDKGTIKYLAVKLTQDLVDHIKVSKCLKCHEYIELHLVAGWIFPPSENYRGRELLGFSNYRMFEKILQDHVAKLKDPAVYLLIAMKDIVIKKFTDVVSDCLFFILLYLILQDKINNIQLTQLKKAEQRISEHEITNKPFQKRSYLRIMRIADKLPLMITFYMLQETAQLLTIDTMKLLEKPDVHELLSEDSAVSKRRKDLRSHLNRLTTVEESIINFFND